MKNLEFYIYILILFILFVYFFLEIKYKSWDRIFINFLYNFYKNTNYFSDLNKKKYYWFFSVRQCDFPLQFSNFKFFFEVISHLDKWNFSFFAPSFSPLLPPSKNTHRQTHFFSFIHTFSHTDDPLEMAVAFVWIREITQWGCMAEIEKLLWKKGSGYN